MNDYSTLTNTLGITNVINSYMRTGDPILDMILMTLIGVIVTNLTSGIGTIGNTLISSIKNIIISIIDFLKLKIRGKLNTIIIEYNMKDQDPKINNKLLIDAILYNFKDANKYKLDNKEINKNFCNEYEREVDRYLILKVDELFEEGGITIEFKSLTKKIKKTLNSNGISNARNKPFDRTEDNTVIEDEIPYLEMVSLTSRKSVSEINKFIKSKRDKFVQDFCSKENSLHIYPVSVYGISYLEFSQIVYNSKKNFTNWFYPEKNKVRNLVNNFKDKTGIYSVPSIQNKLGILLHGEPGCGKTSFIKALANEMDRSIIPIFLDKFTNIQTLKDLFYNDYIYIRGRYSYGEWKYLPINRRLVVFEEIDTAGTIVMDRSKLKHVMQEKRCQKSTILDKYTFYQDMMDDYKSMKMKKTKKTKKNKNKKNKKIKYDSDDSKSESSNDLEDPFDEDDRSMWSDDIDDDIFDKTIKHKSGITLGDLLDLLDGICELDGLVYVITTNHRDYLDPALIRPGRINCDIELKKIRKNEIIEMLRYYYITNNCYNSELQDDKKESLINEIAIELDDKFKPSKLEEICRHYNLTELYDNLNNI
jgi:SpoVK/Ycf46/Vps4 family AAA+-type ATPase